MTWTVGDVMTRDVVTVECATPVQACATRMKVHGVGALPVIAGDRLEGIITESDLTGDGRVLTIRERYAASGRRRREPSDVIAADVMTRRVRSTTADASIAAAAREMFSHRVDRLPVVDTDGRLLGIVSRSDLLRVFLRSDELIRREIAENLSRDVPAIWHGWIVPHVHDGVVTLSGEVEPGTLVDVLLRLVAAVPGVVGVKNELAVTRRSRGAAEEREGALSLARS